MTRYGWPNLDGVETAGTRQDAPQAVCTGCDWSRSAGDGAAWRAIRAAARRHTASTGHETVAGVRTSYRYRIQSAAGPCRR